MHLEKPLNIHLIVGIIENMIKKIQHGGEAERRITCHTIEIAMQAS